MSADQRQHPRFRLALVAQVQLPDGRTTSTSTVGLSRAGLALALVPAPAMGTTLHVDVALPDGRHIGGQAIVRSTTPEGHCGLSFAPAVSQRVAWEAFVDDEEAHGPLWRMIGRASADPDDPYAARGFVEKRGADELRFHTVGENGLAYRLAFARHGGVPPDESDLCIVVPGFRDVARRLVRRVLPADMVLRFDDGRLVAARVVELLRGGYAWVHGGIDAPVGLAALAVGELFLVDKNGAPAFPSFSALELEQIACDTFREDLSRPVFARRADAGTPPSAPPPVELPPLPSSPPFPAPAVTSTIAPAAARSPSAAGPSSASAPAGEQKRFREGYDAVRFAQAASDDARIRRYGDRDIYFHPSVWARVTTDDGTELMGPTLQDGPHVCLLALVGPGTPCVVRLAPSSTIRLLKPPTSSKSPR